MSNMGPSIMGRSRDACETTGKQEVPATVGALANVIHERLVNLGALLDDMHVRLWGPEPMGNPGKDVTEKPSLIRMLELCEQLTHSLTCRANDISAKIG